MIDPKKPEASLAATCKIPPNTKQGIVVVLPSPAGSEPAYRMVFIDDSAKAFPKGECRVLTLLPVEAAIEAGEHKLPVHPGVIASVPPVKKVNEYNMAQTNFYYKQGEAWTAFAERQLQYLDGVRRIFIVHAALGRSPLAMIQHERIERAKNLLTTTDLPVAIIAERCGFQSNERLTVNFRASAGVPPATYRRDSRAKSA